MAQPARQPTNPAMYVLLAGVVIIVGIIIWGTLRNAIREGERLASEAQKQRSAAQATEAARHPAPPPEPYDPIAGAKPVASAWDGITPEVNAYLRKTLNDYRSLEIVDCWAVVKSPDGQAWTQRVRYRARNGFGAYVLSDQAFLIKGGSVIGVLGL